MEQHGKHSRCYFVLYKDRRSNYSCMPSAVKLGMPQRNCLKKKCVYLANLKWHSLSLFLFLFFIHLLIVAEDVLRDWLVGILPVGRLLWGGSPTLFLNWFEYLWEWQTGVCSIFCEESKHEILCFFLRLDTFDFKNVFFRSRYYRIKSLKVCLCVSKKRCFMVYRWLAVDDFSNKVSVVSISSAEPTFADHIVLQ